MKRIAIALFQDVLLLDVAGPMDVFSIANRYLAPEARYAITTVGLDDRPLRASNGCGIQADVALDKFDDDLDLLLVPGGPGAYDSDHATLLPSLQRVCGRAARYGSICTGAFLLGELGLLDDHRVTTHWNYTSRLAKAFPRAHVEPDEIFIGDRRLLTSGGVTAGIDLALSIVMEHHGRELALEVAKVILVAIRRQGGQARFSPLLNELGKQASPLGKVQEYILEHLDEDISVERLATLASMSTRNFSRVFVRELNMTPKEFVQNARVDRARQFLESSDLPMKTIAFRAGFGSVRHMRQLFCQKLGVSPTEYRLQFG